MDQWRPDEHLIDSARAGNLCALDMTEVERSWAVAGLTRLGITADDAASLLGCSLRLIRQIRASPVTHLATLTLELDEALAGCDRRAADAERRAGLEVARAREDLARAHRTIECLAEIRRDTEGAKQHECRNPRCRRLVVQPATGRRRHYCSDSCRYTARYVAIPVTIVSA